MCPLFLTPLPLPSPFPCSHFLSCLPWELFSLLSSVPNSPECTLVGLTPAWSVTSNSLNCAITSGRRCTSAHSTSTVVYTMHYGSAEWKGALIRHLASVLETSRGETCSWLEALIENVDVRGKKSNIKVAIQIPSEATFGWESYLNPLLYFQGFSTLPNA